MNYHALAPKRYKRSVVAGFVHRIYRACSSWALFHESLEKAKKILERNQYPPPYYNSIIQDTIYKIVEPSTTETETSNVEEKPTDKDGEETEVPKKMIFIQYRGKVTEDYCRALKKSEAPVNPIQTLRKLRTVLPSLKKVWNTKSAVKKCINLIVHDVNRAMWDGQKTTFVPVGWTIRNHQEL